MDPFVFVAERDVPDLGVVAGDHLVVAPWRRDWLAIRRECHPNPGRILGLLADGALTNLTPDRPLDVLAEAVGFEPSPPGPAPQRPRRGRRLPSYLRPLK